MLFVGSLLLLYALLLARSASRSAIGTRKEKTCTGLYWMGLARRAGIMDRSAPLSLCSLVRVVAVAILPPRDTRNRCPLHVVRFHSLTCTGIALQLHCADHRWHVLFSWAQLTGRKEQH